ncbi:hypothetical protein OR1_03942 [Geobacter sp. OR-1]|uniref:hypothetical protein n=1 Tax=Geobacter sp. OR-1 TaxID=1266765 RepID=UPI000541EA60|nr:hypothetical protein [Geobacter sp. OR-1]GAM11626.1 hypothetical protein OR1_03942 [Geobacter sp. OR-1]
MSHLADCSVKVFSEISNTKSWSGKPPEGCHANVSVAKKVDGAQVITWITDRNEADWVMTSLTVQMEYSELATPMALAKGNKDVMSRARRLGNCLDSIVNNNDPSECRYKASKEYYASEKIGTERHWEIWLDNGRKSIVDYIIGDTANIPYPPSDLNQGESLPPGTELHLHIR